MLLRTRSLLAGTIWIGAAFRFHAIFNNSFSSDEALFAFWARLIATWRDILLAGQPVDKPPLLFYLEALFFPFFGSVEWAARMPDFIASILIIPLTAMTAWRLFRNQSVALLAAGLVALSPLAIQYSGSAYTDPLLTLFVLASILAVTTPNRRKATQPARGSHGLTAGILFGLAAATKYQAWLFLPLIIALAYSSRWKRSTWLRWSAGLLIILVVLFAWELGRSGNFSLVDTQLASYGGVRFAWSWELWPRFEAWAGIWTDSFATPILYLTLLLSLVLILATLIFQKYRPNPHLQILVAFSFGFFVLHWFLAIPAWERYLLPAIPIIAILISVIISHGLVLILNQSRIGWSTFARVFRLAPVLVVAIQMLVATGIYTDTQRGIVESLVGKDAREIAEYLKDAPYGTVLYDHWYSWQWRYHLFDTKVYINWFSNPEALIEDLQVFRSRQNLNYIVLPDNEAAIPVVRRLTAAGFSIQPRSPDPDRQNGRTMILYEIDSIPIESS